MPKPSRKPQCFGLNPRPALPDGVVRGGEQPRRFNLLHFRTSVDTPVSAFCPVRWQCGPGNAWIATRGHTGADSAFFFLCRCLTLAGGVIIAHGANAGPRARSGFSSPACWWRGNGGPGQRPEQAGRTAYSRTLCLPPLGAMRLADFTWFSGADKAFFGSQRGFK